MLRVVSVGIVSLLLASPAFAIGANCGDQVAQIKGELADHPDAGVRAKVDEAQRLCNEHKDEQSQAVARQIREQLAKDSKGQRSSTGSGTSSPSTAPSR